MPTGFDPEPDDRPVETAYRGKSPMKVSLQLLFLALLAGAVAVGFAASVEFRTRLRVEASTAPWAAALAGGAATILFVCAAWLWHIRIRWVIVSPDGIRWLAGRGIQMRLWDDYVRLERGTIETSVYGEELKTGRYTDVHFKYGRRLRISTHNIHGYEDLIAVIQTMGGSSIRFFVPGSSRRGANGHVATHGPLWFDDDGLGWDGAHYRWEEIESYEEAVGLLRIQPANGPEFLRRLCELGDWRPAMARLDANIGSRRVGHGPTPRRVPAGGS